MEDIQLQAKKQSGKNFKILKFHIFGQKIFKKLKNLKLVLIQNYLLKIHLKNILKKKLI